MKLIHHVAVSTMVSGILYVLFKSWNLMAASLMSGIFLDLDHYIDYLFECGSPFQLKKFFHCIYEERLRKIYLIFHGWKWSIILIILGWMSDWNHWIIGVIIGYGHHMVLDALFNTNWPLSGYSILWRWKNNFVSELVRPRKSVINR
jgi:hypothetical protein